MTTKQQLKGLTPLVVGSHVTGIESWSSCFFLLCVCITRLVAVNRKKGIRSLWRGGKKSRSWYSRFMLDSTWILSAKWSYITKYVFMGICVKFCTLKCVQLHPISKSKCVFELAIQLYLLSISRCFLRKERITCPKTDRFPRFSDNFL